MDQVTYCQSENFNFFQSFRISEYLRFAFRNQSCVTFNPTHFASFQDKLAKCAHEASAMGRRRKELNEMVKINIVSHEVCFNIIFSVNSIQGILFHCFL